MSSAKRLGNVRYKVKVGKPAAGEKEWRWSTAEKLTATMLLVIEETMSEEVVSETIESCVARRIYPPDDRLKDNPLRAARSSRMSAGNLKKRLEIVRLQAGCQTLHRVRHSLTPEGAPSLPLKT